MPSALKVSKDTSGKPLAEEMWTLQQGNDPMISFSLIFDGSVTGFPTCSEQNCQEEESTEPFTSTRER